MIGAGHNGLAAAHYLAAAGWQPLVLERRHEVGGGAATVELHPGFRCPALSHHVLLWSDIVAEMDLPAHGGGLLTPEVRVFAPELEGEPLLVYEDPQRTAADGPGMSPADRASYVAFEESLGRITGVLASLLQDPPPDARDPGARDIWRLLTIGRQFRALGRRDAYRLLRWVPMAVADLLREWFESDRLAAALAGPAVSGTTLGPRSAGSGLVLLLHEAHRRLAGGVTRARGGPGALARAMAASARAAGAEISTGISVERILVQRGRAIGVVAGGEDIRAAHVLSAVDPKTTFLRLVDPLDLDPVFAARVRNYRSAGAMAKVNLALAGLPAFPGAAGPIALSGRIHIGPSLDYLERAFDHAKYGESSAEPWLDVTIPSILDATLAPAGAHVLSAYVHYAPVRLRHGTWATSREALEQTVLRTLERYAPGVGRLVVAAQTLTPEALEADYGMWGGHGFHGELSLDQLFTMRPVLGHARYRSPIDGLWLCGAGTHPGGFLTAASGRLAARQLTS